MSRPTILVTRPFGEAEETVDRLAEAGLEALVSPVLDIRFLDRNVPTGPFSGVIATSGNGVQGLARLAAVRFREHPFFVVGEATATNVTQLGFPEPILIAPDAESLAGMLIASTRGTRAPLLYAAGRDRTPILERRLGVAGVFHEVVELYSAEPVKTLDEQACRAFADGAIAAVLHMSRRSSEAFVAAAETSGVSVPALGVLHAAISAKAAEPLRSWGAQRIAIAEQPTLAAAIVRLRAETRLGYATHSRETRREE